MTVTPTTYPTTIDVLANPTSGTYRDDPGYELDGIISRAQDIAEALEYRVGAVLAAGSEAPYALFGDAAGGSSYEPLRRDNDLINSDFALWPDGTSRTTDGWIAGLWYAKLGTGGSPAFTVSQQAHTLGDLAGLGEAKYFLRFLQSAQATTNPPTLEQPIAMERGVRRWAGQQVTLSFWAKCASGTVVVTPRIRQVFGSGGSPSTEVDTDGATITVTTTRQRFVRTITVPTIAGKTIGSTVNTDFAGVQLRFPLSSTYTVDIDQIKLEAGATASSYAPPDPAVERGRLGLYFERLAATAVSAPEFQGAAVGTADARYLVPYVWEKWKAPTVTFSNDAHLEALNGAWSGVGAGVNTAASIGVRAAQCRMNTIAGSPLTAGQPAWIRWANTAGYIDADARITP